MSANMAPQPRHESFLTPESRQRAFNHAKDILLDLPFNTDFEDYCASPDVNIDIEDAPSPEYCRALADFVERDNKVSTQAGNARTIDMAIAELLSSVPDFAYVNTVLTSTERVSKAAFTEANIRASRFNDLLLEVSLAMPYMTTDELLGHLSDALNLGLRNGPIKQGAQDHLRTRIHGMLHEGIFIQVAQAAGFAYELSSVEQDVHEQWDICLETASGPVRFNVKAGVAKVMRSGGSKERPYSINSKGVVTILSGVHTEEMHGKFKVPSYLVNAANSGAFATLINEIGRQVYSAPLVGNTSLRRAVQ